jgi:uncharacterized membrane protein
MLRQPFAVPALLLFVAAVPLALGWIPRNRFYGVRTAETLADEGVWYTVNRFAAVGVMAASAIYAAVAVLFPYAPAAADDLAVWGLHLAAFALPLLIALSLAVSYAKRL